MGFDRNRHGLKLRLKDFNLKIFPQHFKYIFEFEGILCIEIVAAAKYSIKTK